MSFLAKIFIYGRAINVLDTNVRFYQRIHPKTFRPTSVPMGGSFTITVEADSTTDFLRLMLSPDAMCKGYIRFYKRDGMSKLNDYEFFDTYVVGYQRNFDGVHGLQTTDTLTFSPGILRIGDMVFEKHWKVTDLSEKTTNEIPVLEKPEITEGYFEDVNGNKLTDIREGNINLVVRTSDMGGKTVDIDLGDNGMDLFYEGELVENGILTNIPINGSTKRLKLKAIKQKKEQ